jgi:RNA polymerase sigma factor (sigma-70 family)
MIIMEATQENELVIKVQQKKDEEALTALYAKYLPLIYGFFFKRLGSRVQAEDLTSQTFLEMVKCIEEFEFRSSFKNWLFGVAKNILKSNWTSHYKMKEVGLDEFLHLTKDEEFIVDEKIEKDIDPWEEQRQKLPEVLKLLP